MASHDVAFETELRAHVQRRLALVTAFLGIAGALLALVSRIADWASYGFVLENQFHPSVLTHIGFVLLSIPIYRFLRGRTLGARALLLADAAIVGLVTAACLLIYVFSYETGIRQVVSILALLLIARAIVIPSRAIRTLWLSVPAPLAVLVVQLAHGAVYTLDRQLWPPEGFTAYVLWDQAILWLAVALATGSSFVLYELRVRAHEAARMGRYTLEERIGGGAIGEVWRAHHALIRTPVAVKILRPEITEERNLELFEKEVRRTSQLSHPNTVRIFDYGLTGDGLFYYAMELLDGADLEHVLAADGPLPPSRVIHVLTQACDALDEAHQQGLVHCDVKPANLMLCRRGGRPDVVKVLDFGLARNVARRDGSDATGAAFGTPLSMAPEVIRGQAVHPGTDLYALGAVGYYLATGRLPFAGDTVGEILRGHLQDTPFPPTEYGVPPDLSACLLGCLEKEPSKRPPSAAALRECLRSCRDAGAWGVEDAERWWQTHGAKLHAASARDGGTGGTAHA